MIMKQIEDRAFHLSENERVELAQKLLFSLGAPTMEEIEEDWLVGTNRRAKNLDEGTVQPIPAGEVRKKHRPYLTWNRRGRNRRGETRLILAKNDVL